jgi:general stress protein 26|tara:strand:- start:681 stop:1124 length:444 start_codon:yes stop_codon:yes gene_type:complete
MQLPIELKQAIDNNAFCALATKVNEKEIQNHLMWVDYKEDKILINTEQGRKKTKNIRQEPNISVVIFHPTDMYTCWEIRGVVETIVQDPTANEHIDYLSNRYMGKPYGRTEEITWDEAGFTYREIWEIKVNKIISMVSRAQEKSDSE